MNVYITKGFSPFLLSIEDKSVLMEGQTEFVSQHQSRFVTGTDCTCTVSVFDSIKDIVGTENAPALHANKGVAETAPYTDRLNLYIENGSLKLTS